MTNPSKQSEEQLEADILKVIEHSTMEEHAQVELIMGKVRSYATQRYKEGERAGRIKEFDILTSKIAHELKNDKLPKRLYSIFGEEKLELQSTKEE